MKLTLSDGMLRYRREEISVVQDGVPIPYEWTGPLEITVDDIFERASIKVTPRPPSMTDWYDPARHRDQQRRAELNAQEARQLADQPSDPESIAEGSQHEQDGQHS